MKGDFKKVAIMFGTGVVMAAGAWAFQRFLYPLIPARIR